MLSTLRRVLMRGLVVITILSAFIGCSFESGVTSDLHDYAERLSRVVDTDLIYHSPVATLNYPAENQLVWPLQTFEISLTEFYSLQSCQIGSLVAERNTTLGKQQDQAAVFAYEVSLVNTLNDCILSLDDKHSQLAEKLQDWQRVKRQQLPKVWANMMQSVRENRLAFSKSTELLSVEREDDDSAGVTALAYLVSLSKSTDVSLDELNRQLKILDASRLPAKLWRTQNLLAARLNDLTTALKVTLPNVSCENGRASEQAEILRNVFYLFFIEKIQPVGSRLNHLHYQLTPVLEQLQASPSIQPAFKQYIEARNSEFHIYQSSMSEHVKLWQTFLGRCNLSPQKPA